MSIRFRAAAATALSASLLVQTPSFRNQCAIVTAKTEGAAAAPVARPLDDELGLGWASRRDMTAAEATAHYDDYRARGYMLIDLDASGDGCYSMVWQENPTGRRWQARFGLTDSGYSSLWTSYRDAGYRPHDVECYETSAGMRYAGIWVDNTEGLGWYSYRNLTDSQYSTTYGDLSGRGYRVVDVEAYETPSGLRYACVWLHNSEGVAWAQLRHMSSATFEEHRDNYAALGYRLLDVESYRDGGNQRYAAIWQHDPARGAALRVDRTESQHKNDWNEMYDKGHRLIDFERYTTSSGTRYATVWAENNVRYDWSRKNAINDLVAAYRDANDIEGISVAIVDGGSMVYRRGFGSAAAGRDAHGETVYLAASVAKVIGGTLAAKLESEGRLWDGTAVSLDLARRTRHYLTTMPSHHQHTVQQLLSHTACIWHYDGATPPIRHYATARDAVDEIWDDDLLPGCTLGVDWNYSTHAFAFVGAVLEQVSGRAVARLVREEIAERYSLPSMRAQFETDTLPANEDRSRPYTAAGTATTYDDNSWKVLGGGIECSAVDMAWFGWKVLNAEIVSATTRDNRLWAPISTSNGLGWALDTQDGRRTAGHSGSWTGAGTRLRVYRDDGVVIAIMANRNGHDTDALADDIGDVVFRP